MLVVVGFTRFAGLGRYLGEQVASPCLLAARHDVPTLLVGTACRQHLKWKANPAGITCSHVLGRANDQLVALGCSPGLRAVEDRYRWWKAKKERKEKKSRYDEIDRQSDDTPLLVRTYARGVSPPARLFVCRVRARRRVGIC